MAIRILAARTRFKEKGVTLDDESALDRLLAFVPAVGILH